MTFNGCMATSGAMAMQHWPCRATCNSSFICLVSKPASAGSPTVKSWCVAPSKWKQLSLRGVISARPDAVLAEVKKDYESLNYSAHKSNSVAGASRFSSSVGNCAYWFVKMEKPGVEVVTKAQMVDYFAQTLTKVLGNEKDAQVCVYNILWEKDYGFCCQIDEECAHELSDVPGVLSVQPDMNFESENKNYKGVISARHDTARAEIKKDYESSNLSAHQSNSVAGASRFSPSVGNCAYWLVKMEKPGVEVVTKAQMVDYFAWTLTKVLGNENDAQVCIYNISWEKDYGFCCQIGEECARKLSDVPGVLSVQPDVNFESENKNYKVDDMPTELRDSGETTLLPDVKTKRLFVTGLSFYTSEKTLRAAFEPFGELVEVKIIMDKISKRSKGYAFIEYTTEEAAGAAWKEMNGKIINGWMIVVDVAKTNPPKYSRGRPRPPSSSASYTS